MEILVQEVEAEELEHQQELEVPEEMADMV
jgi:hypothetical protein